MMTSMPISSKEKWEKQQRELQLALEKEIHLMREILANLHQEELALLENSIRRLEKATEERSDFVMQIREQRQKRIDSTVILTKLAIEQNRKEILPPEEEASCDILTKLDQLIALSERINLQNCRNEALFEQSKQKQILPLVCEYPHPLHKRRERKSVATDQKSH